MLGTLRLVFSAERLRVGVCESCLKRGDSGSTPVFLLNAKTKGFICPFSPNCLLYKGGPREVRRIACFEELWENLTRISPLLFFWFGYIADG